RALETHVLVRPRAAGRAPEGLVRQERERRCGAAGIYASRPDERLGNVGAMEAGPRETRRVISLLRARGSRVWRMAGAPLAGGGLGTQRQVPDVAVRATLR